MVSLHCTCSEWSGRYACVLLDKIISRSKEHVPTTDRSLLDSLKQAWQGDSDDRGPVP